MSTLMPLYIYLVGAVLVAVRVGWHIHFRLDKYDWMFCEVWPTFWIDVILWPLLFLKPTLLIQPKFSEPWWREGRAEAERQMDQLEGNPPPCGGFIRFRPEHDKWGECDADFIFAAAEVAAIIENRLVEIPTEDHGRYPAILNWLRKSDASLKDSTDVPAPWSEWFLNVAIGMMNRKLGVVRCRQCDDVVPHERISLEWEPKGLRGSGWRFNVWRCHDGHKLLTKDSMHIFTRSDSTRSDTDVE